MALKLVLSKKKGLFRTKYRIYYCKRLTNNMYVISDIGRMSDILDVNDAVLVSPPYMLLHIGRLLRDEVAVGTLKPRRLAAFVFQVRRQAALRAIHARTIHAGKSHASVKFLKAVSCQFEGCTET